MLQALDFPRRKGLQGKCWDSPRFVAPPVVTTKVIKTGQRRHVLLLTIWGLGFPITFEPFDVQIPHWQAFRSVERLLKSEKSPHQRHVELSWRLTDVAAAQLPELNGGTTVNYLVDAPFLLCSSQDPLLFKAPSFSFWGVGLAIKRVYLNSGTFWWRICFPSPTLGAALTAFLGLCHSQLEERPAWK